MDLTFVIPSTVVPMGGVVSLYQFAESMLPLGHDVRIVHVDLQGIAPAGPEELGHLIEFDPRVEHEVVEAFTGDLSGGDVVFCFDGRVPADAGLPLMWIQAIGVLGWQVDREIFGASCPKLCTSSWLGYLATQWGNPSCQVEIVPYGLDHGRFRSLVPLAERPPHVSMLYHPALVKGTPVGLRALEIAKARQPGLRATLFGTTAPVEQLPEWVEFVLNPPQSVIVDRIFNGHSAFLLPSMVEGFGITGIEAQACGTPLIVTANGGSADYAIHEVSALVTEPGDAEGMAEQLSRVLVDRELAMSLAAAGLEVSSRFDWRKSAQIVDAMLDRYVAEPAAHSHAIEPIVNPSWADLQALRVDFHSGIRERLGFKGQ